jgi:hypothetical protein
MKYCRFVSLGVSMIHAESSATGGVAEWFKALVLKTSEGVSLP